MNKRSFDVVVMSSALVCLFVIAYMYEKRIISRGVAMTGSLAVIALTAGLTLTVRKNIGKKEPEKKPNRRIGNINPKPKKKNTNNSVFYIIGTIIPMVGLIWYLVSNSKTSGTARAPIVTRNSIIGPRSTVARGPAARGTPTPVSVKPSKTPVKPISVQKKPKRTLGWALFKNINENKKVKG